MFTNSSSAGSCVLAEVRQRLGFMEVAKERCHNFITNGRNGDFIQLELPAVIRKRVVSVFCARGCARACVCMYVLVRDEEPVSRPITPDLPVYDSVRIANALPK